MSKKNGTVVTLRHGKQRRDDLSKWTKRTLGSGNLREAVRLPDGEDMNEWLATNIVDFYNEVMLLYDMCSDDAERFTKEGEGFPPQYEYRWAESKNEAAIRCSSPEYINHVLVWLEDMIHDESVFPTNDKNKFPSKFDEIASKMLSRIFRIFAIIYHSHFEAIEAHEAASHLNTAFKHFIFFTYEHGMLADKEYKALDEPVKRLISEYKKK